MYQGLCAAIVSGALDGGTHVPDQLGEIRAEIVSLMYSSAFSVLSLISFRFIILIFIIPHLLSAKKPDVYVSL